jgi:molecular chaperone GrpE
MSKGTEKEMVTDKMTEEKETSVEAQSSKKDSRKSTSTKTKKKSVDKELEKLKAENVELKDKYLRLYSEFENYRRRTAKEKLELVGTANEDLMIELLPVIDDFERALKASENDKGNGKSFEEGIQLIYNKLKNVTEKKGLKIMNTEVGDEFNSEIHDAITQIPAPDKKLKGKIVDTIEKGYYLNDKVIRFAKIVIGA